MLRITAWSWERGDCHGRKFKFINCLLFKQLMRTALTPASRIIKPAFFMENFDNFLGSIAAAVLKSGLDESTTVGMIVCLSLILSVLDAC